MFAPTLFVAVRFQCHCSKILDMSVGTADEKPLMMVNYTDLWVVCKTCSHLVRGRRPRRRLTPVEGYSVCIIRAAAVDIRLVKSAMGSRDCEHTVGSCTRE